jgi:adenylate kinase
MERGDLIADDLVIAMVLDVVLGPGAGGGFVLDGFPRTVPQATAAYEAARRHGVTLQAVVFLEVPHDHLLARLAARRADSGRADDTEATIRHRIDVYMAKTLPLVDYYAGRRILRRVDATGTIDEVTARVFTAIDDQLASP